MEILILKSMIEGVHLAVYSSIKPGSIHRLRLDRDAQFLVSNTISAVDYIIEAIEYGERVRHGDIALTGVGIGRLLAKALRESYRWNGGIVYPSTIIPQILYSIALSHSNIDSYVRESGKVKESLNLILGINKWSEIRQVLDALKSVHRNDMYEHLTTTGITPISGIEGGVSFAEIFRVLGSKWPAFTSLDLIDYRIPEYVKKLLEYYKIYGSAENAIVALYLELIKDRSPEWARKTIEDILANRLIATREGAKKLFEIDTRMRKENISFKEYVGLLAIAAALAIYDGMRP